MFNMVIFGAPGSGKGTQSDKLIEKYGFYHISTGDVLRDQIARKTEAGILADRYISEGHLVPDEHIIKILGDVLDENREKMANGIVFDGFPRTVNQAVALEQMLKERGSEVNAVIGLEVDEDELIARLVNRGKTSGRKDDNPETIRERLVVYHDSTCPLKEFYTKNSKYRGIDGTGSVDEIFERICKEIER